MRWLLLLTVVLIPHTALAQYNVPAAATGDSQVEIAVDDSGGDVIARSEDPDDIGQEVGASLDFLTRDGGGGQRAFKFTDVVLFRAHTLIAIGRRTEVFAGFDLLPKQPNDTDELNWQGGLLGVRFALNKNFSTYARGSGGPGLARDGSWLQGEAAVQARMHIAERVLYWESALGGVYTRLFPDDDTKVWQTELLVQTGIALRERRGFFAGWLNFGFHFPIADKSPAAAERDPQTRVGVSLGALIGVTRGLDLFVEFSILDRGDLMEPATTLPILEGGFDQKRLLFGFNRRFGSRRR